MTQPALSPTSWPIASEAANDQHLTAQHLDGNPALDALCTLLRDAWMQGCHELHIDEESTLWRVRLRALHGLTEHRVPTDSALAAAIARFRDALPAIRDDEVAGSSYWQFDAAGQTVLLRSWYLAATATLHLRIELWQRRSAPLLDTLGFSAGELMCLRDWLSRPGGWVIVASSLPASRRALHAALAQELNAPDRILLNIASLHEHPMPREVRLSSVTDAGVSPLPTILAAQRPDVLLLEASPGSGLSPALLELVLHHGLLVQTTHASDLGHLKRQLAASGQSDAFLQGFLRGLVMHYPVYRLCEHCRQVAPPSATERQWLARHRTPARENVMAWLNEGELHHYLTGEGCEACGDSGLSGQHDLYEMVGVDAILGIAGASGAASRRESAQPGLPKLLDRALELARRGEIPLSEVIRICP